MSQTHIVRDVERLVLAGIVQNARFRIWLNDQWVILTLNPGETLQWGYRRPDEEGYSAYWYQWSYHDYHQSRVNVDGSWARAVDTVWQYGGEERDIAQHARFMDDCGPDFIRYRRFTERARR